MTQKPYEHIAVLGAGAWGTALALAALAAGRKTSLWVREDDVLAAIRRGEENPFLPGVALPKTLAATGDLAEAAQADALLLVVPAQVLHGFAAALAPHLAPGTPLVICAKGIEKGSGRLVNETLIDAIPGLRARDPVRSILRPRCGARPAHRGDHRGRGRVSRRGCKPA